PASSSNRPDAERPGLSTTTPTSVGAQMLKSWRGSMKPQVWVSGAKPPGTLPNLNTGYLTLTARNRPVSSVTPVTGLSMKADTLVSVAPPVNWYGTPMAGFPSGVTTCPEYTSPRLSATFSKKGRSP